MLSRHPIGGEAGGRVVVSRPPALFFTGAMLGKVRRKKAWTVRVAKKRLKDCWGFCDFANREIVLCPSTESAGVKRQTLFHELIHKVCPWMEEEAVDHLATELDDGADAMGL